MSDVTDLCALIAGTTVVFDCRYSVTVVGTDAVLWGDANGGSSTFAGHLTQASAGAPMSANGTTQGMGTGADYNLSLKHSLIYIGTVESSGYIATAMYDSTDDLYDRIGAASTTVQIAEQTQATAASTTPRLVLSSRNFHNAYGGGSLTPTAAEAAQWVQGRVGTSRMLNAAFTNTNRACKLYVAGLRPDFAISYTGTVQAIIITDHPVTSTEWAAIKTWATTYHTWTSDDTVTVGAVYFDGNSLTSGLNTATPGFEYPTVVMEQSGMSGWDWDNFGVGARTGATQLVSIPWRVNPFFSGNQTAKVYVCWEIGNDIAGGASAATAAQNILDMCASAKAAGATHCIAVTAGPRLDLSGSTENTKRLAANAIVLAAVGTNGIDLVADVASIPQLQDYTDTTYFNADEIHYTDAGYALVATDATNGVYPAIIAAISGVTINPTGFGLTVSLGTPVVNSSTSFVVIASDTFVGTDHSNVSGRTLDNGLGGTESDTWSLPEGGTAEVLSNEAHALTDGTNGQVVLLVGSTAAIGVQRVTITPTRTFSNTNVGAIVRYDSGTGKYYLGFSSSPGHASEFYYWNGTSFTLMATGTLSTGPTGTIAIEANGTSIKTYVNGVVDINTTDTNIATGRPGIFLRSAGGGATADNFYYEAFGPPAPGDVNVLPTGFGLTVGLGLLDIQADTSLLPVGYGLTITRGTPTLSIASGGNPITVLPAGFGLAVSLGTPSLSVGIGIAPTGFGLTISRGTPGVNVSATVVNPTGFGLTVSLGTPTTTNTHVIINPIGFGLTVSLGIPNVNAGRVLQSINLMSSDGQAIP